MAKSKLQAPYTETFHIGTSASDYDQGTIDVSVQGKRPISVGFASNQILAVVWKLYLVGNTLYYGRRALEGNLASNYMDFIVQYI